MPDHANHSHATQAGSCCAHHANAQAPIQEAGVPPETLYTCPMHPEVRQVGPGTCPICGMALEPVMPAAEEDDSELRKVRRKFWIAAALAIPLFVVAMVPHWLGARI